MSSKGGTKKRKTWRCDVCQIAIFDTYDEALDHEQSCQGNTEADIDALAVAVARGRVSGAITNAALLLEEGQHAAAITNHTANNNNGGGGMLEEEDDVVLGEEDEEEGMFGAVSSGRGNGKNYNTTNNKGKFMNGAFGSIGAAGPSPSVSTPTVLALLANSRATAGAGAGAGGGGAGYVSKNNGGGRGGVGAATVATTAPPVITLPDVLATTNQEVTTSSSALPKQQSTSTVLVHNKGHESALQRQQQQQQQQRSSAVPITTAAVEQSTTSPPNKNNNNTPPHHPNQPRNKWRCDYCPAIFNEYDEAVIHETECKTKKHNNNNPLVVPSSSSSSSQKQQPSVVTTNNHTNTPKQQQHQQQQNVIEPSNTPPIAHRPKTPWKCDYCPALFHSYNEAVQHEINCKLNDTSKQGMGIIGIGNVQQVGVPMTICIPTKVPPAAVAKEEKELVGINKDNTTDAALSSSPLLPPPPPPSNINNNQKRLNWKCDVCLVAVFESYDEALEHENQCKGVGVIGGDDGEEEGGGGLLQRNTKKTKSSTTKDDVIVVQQQQQQQEQQQQQKTKKGEKEKVGGGGVVPEEKKDDRVEEDTKEKVQKDEDVEQLPRKKSQQSSQVVQKERVEMPNQEQVQPAKVLHQPGLQKRSVEVDREKENEADKGQVKEANQAEVEKQQEEDDLDGSSRKNVFLSLKDDYYRTHIFTYFRKLGAIKQYQRDNDEEKKVKEEAFIFFKSSGCKLVKCHDWKRPELGHFEVDDEYARRKISDDIRRRLDQRNLWDVITDGESGEADESSIESPIQVVVPKKNQVASISNDAVVNEVQANKAPEQPIAKQIVEEIVQQVEMHHPKVQQPQIIDRIVQLPPVQKPEASLPKAQQPDVHQPIVQQQYAATKTTSTNKDNTNEKQAAQIKTRNFGVHHYLYGTTLRNHVGNRKYHEMASKKMDLYQNAKPSEKAGIAASVVNEWRALDPPGRFLKSDNTGCFADVGNDKAIAKTKKILRAKPASPTKTNVEGSADSIPGRESSMVSSLNVSANLNRSEDDTSNTNAMVASIAQMAEEEHEKETEPLQLAPSTSPKRVETTENRNMLRPILKLVPLVAILLIATITYALPHNRMRWFEILFIPAVVVLTLFLVWRLTTAYSSFALTAATITDRRVRQVRLFHKVFLLPFLASVLIFVPVSLYLQPERVITVLLMPKVALLTLSPILLSLAFALAMIVTHEAPHHHIEGGFFTEVYNFAEDTFRHRPPGPSITDEGKCLLTLRDYLSHPEGFHMAFAPAFFGFFAYFGALAALEEATGGLIVPPIADKRKSNDDASESLGLRSVSGASAGAMAATLLACGIDPSVAAEFTSKFTWGMVSDPPGIGGYVKGNRFEEAMVDFLSKEASKVNRADRSSDTPLQFEEALIPCAVTGFDLFRMKGVILSSGPMAKAARASAGFPGLFQPVAWRENSDEKKWLPDSLLIDGGIRDGLGLAGLGAFASEKKRVVNLVVGDFGFRGASGIQSLPKGVNASSLVSIALVGTPMCGPWAMENGKRAVESARKAMLKAFDAPMEKGDGENHYVLRVDASKFLD